MARRDSPGRAGGQLGQSVGPSFALHRHGSPGPGVTPTCGENKGDGQVLALVLNSSLSFLAPHHPHPGQEFQFPQETISNTFKKHSLILTIAINRKLVVEVERCSTSVSADKTMEINI